MTKQAISDADLAFMFANHMREILAHPDHLSREHLVELAFAAAGMIDGASTLDEPLIHIRQSPYITACAQTIAEVRLNVITAVASAKMGEDIVGPPITPAPRDPAPFPEEVDELSSAEGTA